MTTYAEGPETSVEVTISAPADAVWAVVTDPALPARFSNELVEASWFEHPSGSPGVGSVIEGHNENEAMGRWTTRSIVTEWDPPRSFAWAVRDVEDSAARWGFALDPVEGGTRLRQHYRIGPGPSGLSRFIEQDPENEEQIISHRLHAQGKAMARTLEAVKDLVEGGDAEHP
jgi:uncharacterized protein YndB with AHSA1/START domain